MALWQFFPGIAILLAVGIGISNFLSDGIGMQVVLFHCSPASVSEGGGAGIEMNRPSRNALKCTYM